MSLPPLIALLLLTACLLALSAPVQAGARHDSNRAAVVAAARPAPPLIALRQAMTSAQRMVFLPLVELSQAPRLEDGPIMETLVPGGARWKYLDDGSDPGVVWRLRSFDDSAWPAGPAELGYGDGDEATVIGCGDGTASCTHRAATVYFRHTFTVSNAADFTILDLLLRRDDGVIVYLNDHEVVRNNMPASAVTHTTPAVATVSGVDEVQIYHYPVSPTLLMEGVNVLAAELHQVSATSSDLSFDLALAGARKESATIRFAAIGDYGNGSRNETKVAGLVKSWRPDFVITQGDNNYPIGAQATITHNIGRDYGEFVRSGRFFPALGNHDWLTKSAQAYLDYFDLPGNERYYDFVRGDVQFFVLDSDPHEPDYITDVVQNMTSPQALWLRDRLAASNARWKIVYFHHAPYSSSVHSASQHDAHIYMRWPFADWGACAVLAGHEHVYERLFTNGIPYFVNGLGGVSPYDWRTIHADSKMRFNDDNGAMLITAAAQHITFQFITQANALIDAFSLGPGDCQAE